VSFMGGLLEGAGRRRFRERTKPYKALQELDCYELLTTKRRGLSLLDQQTKSAQGVLA